MRSAAPFLAMAFCLAVATARAESVHVAVDGNDRNPGTAEKPLATIQRALALTDNPKGPEEIILHGGAYPGKTIIRARADKDAAEVLLIRAAGRGADGYEKVVIDGGRKVAGAQSVKGAAHVFAIPCHLKDTAVSMWENDTRVRYRYLADIDGVSAHRGSLVLEAGQIYFHTSDGRPPEAHDIGVARDQYGFFIWRGNVTVQGLRFRSFINGPKGRGIAVYADNVTIRDCQAWNCRGAYNFHTVKNGRVVNCEARDVGYGVFSYGEDTAVENCRFFREAGAFEVQLYNQDQAGIQYYYPAARGVIRHNLCVGFDRGIFLKCRKSAFLIEHNTAVAKSGRFGIGCTAWHPKTVCRYNIIQGYQAPFVTDRPPDETVITTNCVWNRGRQGEESSPAERQRTHPVGAGNFVADPLFAGAREGDYRLSPRSPCAAARPDGTPIGALNLVGEDFHDRQPPDVRLRCSPPARYHGLETKLYHLKGGRAAGSAPRLIDRSIPKGSPNCWIAPPGEIVLAIAATDDQGEPRQLRLKIGGGKWSAAEAYQSTRKIVLPDAKTPVTIQVSVSDGAGNWSEPKQITVVPAAPRIQMEREPSVRVNSYGATIAFATDVPCYARIEYGDGRVLKEPEKVEKDWHASLDGELIRITSGPRKGHRFALIAQEKRGQRVPYRILLSNGMGVETTAHEGVLCLEGRHLTFHVAVNGQDGRERGGRDEPFRSLQYACDHALPGDTIVVLPGVYTGQTILTHGGPEGAPIRIRSSTPGKAILDGGKAVASCLRLNESPYVEISGFEIRWFTGAGIYLSDSPHVTVRECFFWNDHHYGRRPTGDGLFCRNGTGLVVDHNVFFTSNRAITIMESPSFRMTHNSIANTLHGGGRLLDSIQNSVCRNNSITFTGNEHFLIVTSGPEEMESFDCDYNNLAMHLRGRPPANKDIEPIKGDFFERKTSKFLMRTREGRHGTLEAWRDAFGKDRHSIFKNPLYNDPASHDFRLKPSSPNIGVGENGATIGALGVVE